MQWSSFSEFLSMGGHGYFVWCAYGMAILLLVLETMSLAMGRKSAKAAVKKEAAKLAAREKAAKAAAQKAASKASA